jgi:hypothetical protein
MAAPPSATDSNKESQQGAELATFPTINVRRHFGHFGQRDQRDASKGCPRAKRPCK